MVVTTYRTLSALSKGEYKEKMSRFLSFAQPVSSADDVSEALISYRRLYHDARHICWGYRIGYDGSESRGNDNGEPSGTAGKPIIGQLLSNNITNVLIVVVRYFGGIKLGTGGLVSAYRQAAAEAIKNGVIVERRVKKEIEITFDYISTDPIMKLFKEEFVEVKKRNFGEHCSMLLSVSVEYSDLLLLQLSKIQNVIIKDNGIL